MGELTKKLKKELRRLACIAHEEELRRALAPLYAAFELWQARKMDSFELNEKIHAFHQGPSRDLFVFYTSGMLELMVARALVDGLKSGKTPAELLFQRGHDFHPLQRVHPRFDDRRVERHTLCPVLAHAANFLDHEFGQAVVDAGGRSVGSGGWGAA